MEDVRLEKFKPVEAEKMLRIEIIGPPVPWAAAVVLKKGLTYSPKARQKALTKLEIKRQYFEAPSKGSICLEMYFFMPIPKSTPEKKIDSLLQGYHSKKPDTTNLQKFAEDCLSGIVFIDDSQVFQTFSKKIYSENPKTVIYIYQL
jgi:Holliday junction resolvase RusA-like endonuclease